MYKCQIIYIKNNTFIYFELYFGFFQTFKRLSKITKSVKSINLKTN